MRLWSFTLVVRDGGGEVVAEMDTTPMELGCLGERLIGVSASFAAAAFEGMHPDGIGIPKVGGYEFSLIAEVRPEMLDRLKP